MVNKRYSMAPFAMQFKIFINVFAFKYVMVNSAEICEQNILSLFLQKNVDVSIFVEIQG